MQYLIRHLIVAAEDEHALSERFLAAGYTGFVLASRADGRFDCHCYGTDGVLPAVVDAVCARWCMQVVDEVRCSEAELLAGALDGEACELRPGVWIDPGAEVVETAERLVLRVPPAPAFGNGRHPSTRLAAALLAPGDVAGRRVWDLGCGTGVLGILAHRWGAAAVTFTDCDAAAVATAAAVAADNGFAPTRCATGDLLAALPDAEVDVLIGNIYGDLCQRLLDDPQLARALPCGLLILSGISHQHRDAVLAALADAGFALEDERTEAWWCAVRARSVA